MNKLFVGSTGVNWLHIHNLIIKIQRLSVSIKLFLNRPDYF